ALDRLTVHRAGFGPAWSHLVGVVAAEHDVAGPDGFNAAASADAVSLNVRGQGRIALPGGREAAGMVAARTSAWDVYRDPGLSDLLAGWDAPDPLLLSGMAGYPVVLEGVGFQLSTPDAAFSDLHAAGHLRLSPFRTLHVSGYRARNRLGGAFAPAHPRPSPFRTLPASGYRARNRLGGAFAAYRPETPFAPTHLLLTRNDYDWTNWAGQARLDGLIGARATYSAQATGGHHESRYGYRGGVELTAPLDSPDALDAAAEALYPTLTGAGSDWHHTIRELALKGTLAYSLSPRSLVEGGLAVEHTEGAVRSAGFLTAAFAHEARAWDVAAHAAGHFGLGPAVTVEPGVRLTYFPERQTVYAEPR